VPDLKKSIVKLYVCVGVVARRVKVVGRRVGSCGWKLKVELGPRGVAVSREAGADLPLSREAHCQC
jgi:hypothetical protein